MTVLPEPTPTAPAAGQAHNPLTDSIISAAIEHAIEKAKRQGTSPDVLIGNTPPVPQPGRPAMSQGATDASTLMLSGGVATVLVGGAASLVMVASGHADPVVCAIVLGAPTTLALAIARVLRRAKNVLPAEHHHHYSGPVDQRTTHTSTRGVWAKTNNQQ